jgi:hypothetical protein
MFHFSMGSSAIFGDSNFVFLHAEFKINPTNFLSAPGTPPGNQRNGSADTEYLSFRSKAENCFRFNGKAEFSSGDE